jgi:hypothetical protein
VLEHEERAICAGGSVEARYSSNTFSAATFFSSESAVTSMTACQRRAATSRTRLE